MTLQKVVRTVFGYPSRHFRDLNDDNRRRLHDLLTQIKQYAFRAQLFDGNVEIYRGNTNIITPIWCNCTPQHAGNRHIHVISTCRLPKTPCSEYRGKWWVLQMLIHWLALVRSRMKQAHIREQFDLQFMRSCILSHLSIYIQSVSLHVSIYLSTPLQPFLGFLGPWPLFPISSPFTQ
jgi:hypothetical protein